VKTPTLFCEQRWKNHAEQDGALENSKWWNLSAAIHMYYSQPD